MNDKRDIGDRNSSSQQVSHRSLNTAKFKGGSDSKLSSFEQLPDLINAVKIVP